MGPSHKIEFPGALGETLAARLDLPEGPVRATALFAHCFACSKDVLAAARIAQRLAEQGVAVLRFDFTGLGQSAGDFANTDFSSNLGDLKAAAAWLRENRQAPSLLIGHSLGGAAVIAAAADIPEARAVAVIGAPATAAHVEHNFKAAVPQIEREGEALVELGGKPFRVRRQFLEDIRGQSVERAAANLRRALLILHSPTDDVVGVENATQLFVAAKHPKSFVSLDGADHLLRRREDAAYAADVIAAWAARYAFAPGHSADPVPPSGPVSEATAIAEETRAGPLENRLVMGPHTMLADEPAALGGGDAGPAPFDLLSGALATCTTMTVRLYADRKGWPLERVRAEVTHEKAEPASGGGHVFHRTVRFEGPLDGEQRRRLLEIAQKCPVHRVLEQGASVETRLAEP